MAGFGIAVGGHLQGQFHFFTLTLFGALLYAGVWTRNRANRLAFHLALVSVAALGAGLPLNWLPPGTTRSSLVGAGLAGYAVLLALRVHTPLLGVTGAMALAGAINSLGHQFHLGLQCGLVFLVLHTTRWKVESFQVVAWQIIASVSWVVHAAAWVHVEGLDAAMPVSILVTATLAWCWVDERFLRRPVSRIIVAAAVSALLSIPANSAGTGLRRAHAGLVAVVLSFVLFGAGTLLALARRKWEPGHSNLS